MTSRSGACFDLTFEHEDTGRTITVSNEELLAELTKRGLFDDPGRAEYIASVDTPYLYQAYAMDSWAPGDLYMDHGWALRRSDDRAVDIRSADACDAGITMTFDELDRELEQREFEAVRHVELHHELAAQHRCSDGTIFELWRDPEVGVEVWAEAGVMRNKRYAAQCGAEGRRARARQQERADVGWRIVGSQIVRLSREPLAVFLARLLGVDVERATQFLATELGATLVAALLSVGVPALSFLSRATRDALSAELRQLAMATAADTLVDVVAAPLRRVIATSPRGVVPATPDPAGLTDGSEHMSNFEKSVSEEKEPA